MRAILLAAATLAAFASPASAQSAITLDARAGAPVVEARINDRPVRLEVDLRMPDALALSNEAAQRLGVRRVPLVAVRIGIEGSDATIRGRVARPRLVFDGGASRAFAAIFPAPVTTRADGVIGPGALPYDVITVTLGDEPEGARDIVFQLDDADAWEARMPVGGETLRVQFHVGDDATVFNRSATRAFDASGAIVSVGDVAETPLVLGLRTMMQPVETELSVAGLTLRPARARTNSPLLGATEPDAIVIAAQSGDPPPPSVNVGRAALSACAWLRVDRRARTLTLRCAG